jgi:hypothetical protein
LSGSANKKIIPIIIVAVIAIGAFAIIFNSDPSQNQIREIEQANVSEETPGPIQEIKETSESESTSTSKLEIEQANVSEETLGPIQEIKETSESESTPTSKLESKQSTQLRAAIIDQLHEDIPNYELQTNATSMLEDAGYQVDLYTTKDITVEFYKKLPSMNYNFILIRSHGGEDSSDENPTFLFTGEKYIKEKYIGEQISRQVGYGFPIYSEELTELKRTDPRAFDQAYFTIGSKLVKEGMVGTFPNSIIIVGGCESAESHDLMESFLNKGAKHVLGWGATVGSADNDKAMVWLLEEILVKDGSILDAVSEINEEMRPSFRFPAILKLFNAV